MPQPTVRTKSEIEQGLVFEPRFDEAGLVAAIVTDASSGEVLMFAWMNEEALNETLRTGIAHFWSRSRGRLWKKGEESGNFLSLTEMWVDCDQDAILMKVTVGGRGAACHTGERSCFYRKVVPGANTALGAVLERDVKRTAQIGLVCASKHGS